MQSWAAYVCGEVDGLAGESEHAEQHYLRAIELAHNSGATFMVGIATVGLLTVRANAGRVEEALNGYRQVIDYFAGTGNWTHLWATLRNLANLLDQLGDHAPAQTLRTAAASAPDAPANEAAPTDGPPAEAAPAPVDRADLLRLARESIERNLTC